MYEQNRESSMDALRAKFLSKIVVEDEKLTSKSKIDLARLPPCHSALKPHLHRLKHHVALYKLADEAILAKLKPYDDGQGWIRTDDGVLEPVWSCGAALPNSLINLLYTGDREEKKEEEENEDG
ncbi:hypothetical protein NP493_378g02042 [Ridgeia piscesae]|uniref:Uncharacterized protein n=1 Tax=Ridgeia piscesae TaxID=27915 RepID=A0AAD9NT52_RIDPI|nr:hypothetical protein NP493_378g02042 [Ridgeia piscesae]